MPNADNATLCSLYRSYVVNWHEVGGPVKSLPLATNLQTKPSVESTSKFSFYGLNSGSLFLRRRPANKCQARADASAISCFPSSGASARKHSPAPLFMYRPITKKKVGRSVRSTFKTRDAAPRAPSPCSTLWAAERVENLENGEVGYR